MFLQILTFEIQYRLKRPATYAFFFILFMMAFLAIYTKHIGIGEAVYILHTVEDVIDISGRRHIKAPKLVCAFREICSRRIPRSFVVVSDLSFCVSIIANFDRKAKTT